MDEIVKEFLIESKENLDRLDQELVKLESDPSSKELLASIFRTIHTIKGSCGFLGFPNLEKVSHTGEGLLARLRDGELVLNEEITSALLSLVDAVRGMLTSIADSGQDGAQDFAELIGRLRALQESSPGSKTHSPASSPSPEPVQNFPTEAPTAEPPTTAPVTETIRVGVNVLDRLMNLVGELVLARNRLLQAHPDEHGDDFHSATQRLNLITGELQDEVMKARMQPISTVWNKFPRTVRDVALACKKEVRLEMQGAEVELDRTILETIRDPLLHLVRNAIDHGIETPEIRQQLGKSPAGTLTLRAFHEAGRVHLEINDDGAGLNRERISQKAIERSLISPQQAVNLTDRDIYQLTFLPGFSTAEAVTSVSGRGVGMDVVKTNVEAIGGIVDLHSVPGKGTTFMIRLPLTLAIIPALLVRCGGERFAIPQANLLELVHLEAGDVRKIETIQGTPIFRLRGRLLPLLSLNTELQLTAAENSCLSQDREVNIIVVRAEKHEFGIIIDEIIDTQEIVVKPLHRHLKRIGIYAGVTIVGDGRVALILDIHGLAQRARLTSAVSQSVPGPAENAHSEAKETLSQPTLIVQCSDQRPRAIPLSMIWRLEEISLARIEMVGSHEVVQYEGGIMPLIYLGRNDPAGGTPARNISLPVVVCQSADGKVGLVVERFLDVADDNLLPQHIASSARVVRAAVIQGQVTELVDVSRLMSEPPPARGDSRAEAGT